MSPIPSTLPLIALALLTPLGSAAPQGSEVPSPPAGFELLLNGADLIGWRGGLGGPTDVRGRTVAELAAMQSRASRLAREHWVVRDGAIVGAGGGLRLATERSFRNFELLLDWRSEPGGSGGVYLRGCPGVGILGDPSGSGGLAANRTFASRPAVAADHEPGAWNTFRIRLVGELVSVWLNDVPVVNRVPLENAWEPERGLYFDGPIELEAEGAPISFRNVFVRILPEEAEPGESRELFEERMAWWQEARFGLFVHWGLYAIPAGVWGGERVAGFSAWIMNSGRIPVEDYEPLRERFDPVRFDAAEWVRIAKAAGMKYIVITSKHHDGFALFDSQQSEYDVMATPFGRDIMKELADAARAAGIRIGWYHSIMDWHHPDYLPRRDWETRSAEGAEFERYRAYMKAQVRELLTSYGPIDVMWFDGEWESTWTHEMGKDLYDFVRAIAPRILVNNRVDKGRRGMAGLTREGDFMGDFGTPEQEVPPAGPPGVHWETCMTMNDSWGYKSYDDNWKSAEEIVRTLCDTASKGGNLLLNVGPTAEGLIPAPSVERLREVGAWLARNGEAIYGTQAGPFRRLGWGRCTAKPGLLYFHVFDWPADGQLVVPGLDNAVSRAWLLADPQAEVLQLERIDGDPVINVPAEPADVPVTVIVMQIEGEADVRPFVLRQRMDGGLTLPAIEAVVHGDVARYESRGGKGYIGYWTSAGDWVEWSFEMRRPGRYAIELSIACPGSTAGGVVEVVVAGSELRGSVGSTGSWTSFESVRLGVVELTEGAQRLAVRPVEMGAEALMNLARVELVPVE